MSEETRTNQATSPQRRLELAATGVFLVALEVLAIVLLLATGTEPLDSSIRLGGLVLLRPWVLGVLGGLLGGTARALYAFHVDVRGYEYRKQTGKSYPTWTTTASGRRVPDEFDFMTVWYLFLIKPFIGAALGFLFALLQRFGLIPFLSGDGTAGGSCGFACDREVYGIVLVAGLAGIFADQAMDRFRSMFGGSEQQTPEGKANGQPPQAPTQMTEVESNIEGPTSEAPLAEGQTGHAESRGPLGNVRRRLLSRRHATPLGDTTDE